MRVPQSRVASRALLTAALAAGLVTMLGRTNPAHAQSARSRSAARQPYFPGRGLDWETRKPEEVGMNPAAIQRAIELATDPKNAGRPEDLLYFQIRRHDEPLSELVGPVKSRGKPTGVIVRHGYIVAEWGEPHRVDMTFSVTKSFLSTVVGQAFDRGLIRDVNDLVHPYMAPVVPVLPPRPIPGSYERIADLRPLEPFNTEHNRKITWDHLLRQTSDWEGVLWGKPDWMDRPEVSKQEQVDSAWIARERHEPGTVYKYNDVRVNALALAALNVWRRPLPEVLKELVMDPIGASDTWRWYGYENSWVVMDGRMMQSMTGGGHWGGGMWISARDQARFGYLTLRNGKWKDRQIMSEKWLALARTPGKVNPGYGFMNYSLNTNRKSVPAAPATAFWHSGAGPNRIYVDQENDLVVVVRWMGDQHFAEFIRLILDGTTLAAR